MAIHLVFDTETTGLIGNSLMPLAKQPRVIEFFGLLLSDDGWSEVGTIHHVVNPGIPISAEITKITGFTDAKIKGKPRIADVFDSITKIIESAGVVAAHNLSYDRQIMNFEAKRLDKKIIWPERQVCTVEATEHFKGHRLNLTRLHNELFGVGFENAHSAEDDVRATARCYIELVKRGEI